jgi:hypothetical protein
VKVEKAIVGIDKDSRYRVALTTEHGKIQCTVSVKINGKPDQRSDEDKRTAALQKVRRLAQALAADIAD